MMAAQSYKRTAKSRDNARGLQLKSKFDDFTRALNDGETSNDFHIEVLSDCFKPENDYFANVIENH